MMSDEEFAEAVGLIDEAISSGRVRLRFWTCPVGRGHPWPTDRITQTVDWDGDVGYCLYRGCRRRSDDDVPRGECLCEEYDCTGGCCGPGQCSCSTPETAQ